MKKKRLKRNKPQNSLNKLSLFQKTDHGIKKNCPLSKKDAPVIDYKNTKLLKRYITEFSKILPTRISNISQNKQRKLTNEIKKARILQLV